MVIAPVAAFKMSFAIGSTNEGECYACSSVVVEMTVPLLKEITRQILQRQSLYSNGCVLCTPLNRSNYNCGGSGYVEGGRSADLFSWSLF